MDKETKLFVNITDITWNWKLFGEKITSVKGFTTCKKYFYDRTYHIENLCEGCFPQLNTSGSDYKIKNENGIT